MNNLKQSYEVILTVLRKVEQKDNFLSQIRTPKLSDIELIALVLTAEYLSIDSEYQLFRMIPEGIYGRIERSVFNRRKRLSLIHISEPTTPLYSSAASDVYKRQLLNI